FPPVRSAGSSWMATGALAPAPRVQAESLRPGIAGCCRARPKMPLSLAIEWGLFIDASCIWRWVQVYGPELDKRCRTHLKQTDQSYRVDETYIRIKGAGPVFISGARFHRTDHRFPAHGQTRSSRSQTIFSENA